MLLLSLLMVPWAFADSDALAIPHEVYTLDNGLEVILAPDHSAPLVYVNVWYHVGAKDEQPGLTGFAHLFEHMLFQGSANAPGEYFTPLQEVGGEINGSTSFDYTQYYEQVPARYLPLALFMESDRMGWLLPVLTQDKLDNQREVVRNERRQRYENPPYGEVWKDLYEAVWPESHPYHHMPIGTHADLEAATLDTVTEFFHTWYAPNNASLVIAGDFETDTAKALVDRYFGSIPRGPEPTETTAEDVILESSEVLRQYDDVPEQKVWMAWISPRLHQPGDADLDLLSSLLSSGRDSRLHQRLVKELKIAKEISAGQSSSMLGSMYVISATASKGHTTDEIVEAVDRVLDEVLGESPPTQDEIESARAAYEVGFYRRLTTVAGKGSTLSRYNHFTGRPDYLQTDLARYAGASPASVLDVARSVLSKNRVTLHVWPESDRPEEEK